ncbi:MAG TPA: ATP-binding protein, partial [Actinomycetota bacterium]
RSTRVLDRAHDHRHRSLRACRRVCDQGPGFDPAEIDWRGHRGGLFLLDTLAYDWGIERNAAGTEVWFEI